MKRFLQALLVQNELWVEQFCAECECNVKLSGGIRHYWCCYVSLDRQSDQVRVPEEHRGVQLRAVSSAGQEQAREDARPTEPCLALRPRCHHVHQWQYWTTQGGKSSLTHDTKIRFVIPFDGKISRDWLGSIFAIDLDIASHVI